MRTSTLVRPQPAAVPAERRTGRLGAVALVAGAALNTGQAVLARALGGADTTAGRLADVDAHPVLTLVMVLGGMLGVVLLLVGLPWTARLLRPHAPRTAGLATVLTVLGTLGFLGLHVLMLLTYVAASYDDRAAAVAVLDHVQGSALGLVLVVPFALGMFGGVLTLVVGLLRTGVVPRWTAVCWAVFVPIDLVAPGAGPVDPHWLFLAGAAGIALSAQTAEQGTRSADRRPASA